MGVTVHTKSESEMTSTDATTSLPRSPRRQLYYVRSPFQLDLEKTSYGSSPFASPNLYHCSPIHPSHYSSTSRFSASLRHPTTTNPAPWKKIHSRPEDAGAEDDGVVGGSENYLRFYVCCFFFSFLLLFTMFSLILWAAGVPFKPHISVKSVVLESFNVQAGMDRTAVPTDMLTLNSTIIILYMNPATFFGVHVTASPVELQYYQLKIASGLIGKFYQSRKSQRIIRVGVSGFQVPLYGVDPGLDGSRGHFESASLPLNLTFVVRSRAYVLGRLVKPKFHREISCEVTLYGNRLGKHLDLTNSCVYE